MPFNVAMFLIVCLSFAAVSCVKGGSPGASPVAVKRTQMHMGPLVSTRTSAQYLDPWERTVPGQRGRRPKRRDGQCRNDDGGEEIVASG
jgi:hypothetical protein